MGTTVTTNLGLIKPDTSEKIQEDLPTYLGWAAQNESNCDTIDGLFRHTYHNYSPTWTADSGNPTLGAGGFVTGKYARIWPGMVFGYIKIFTGGAGFATGTGLYRITLPVAIAAELKTFNLEVAVGKSYFLDASSVITSTNMVVMYDPVNDVLFFRKHDGDAWRHNAPVTLAQNDRMTAYFMYPTEDA